MSERAQIIRGTILLIVLAAFVVWLMVRAFKRSEEPGLLIFKWILTAVVVGFMMRIIAPIVDGGGYAAIGGIFITVACGWILAIIWRRNLALMIAKPFSSLYDGGDQEIEPRPVYSIAQAKRKRGYYAEALAEIRRQLKLFPQDFEGQLLLAEIQAENMSDLPGAEVVILRLCQQPDRLPREIAMALNSLADWHLKYHQDRDAAKRDLEKIVALLPDSELSALAEQRIAHLADTAFLLAPHDRKAMVISAGIADVGLQSGERQPKAPETDPVAVVQDYVQHLAEHPLDTEAREKLAVLYADHYNRLDMAADQLEQLIGHPGQPGKRVVHWLNLLADLQVRHAAEYEAVRHTVQRIVDLFPGTPAAQLAQNRLNLLKLELKGQLKGQAVKLGSYEKNIGLNRTLSD